MSLETLKARAKRNTFVRAVLAPAILTRRFLLRRRGRVRKAVLDNLAGMLVEDPVVRVDEFRGTFCINARSDLFKRIAATGEYEPTLVRRCLELLDVDRDFLDVGANVGFYSVLMGKTLRAGRVLAVEPTRNACERLRDNLARNGVQGKVIVLQAAIANKSGEIDIKTIQGMEEYSSLGGMNHPSIRSETVVTERVPCLTIDEAVARHGLNPGMMKVDVEGMEHVVFGGANILLSQHRPVILSELSDSLLRQNGSSAMQVIEMIRSHGYDVVDAESPSLSAGAHAEGNVFCVPR